MGLSAKLPDFKIVFKKQSRQAQRPQPYLKVILDTVAGLNLPVIGLRSAGGEEADLRQYTLPKFLTFVKTQKGLLVT